MDERIKSFVRSNQTFFAIILLLTGSIAYGLGLEAGQLHITSNTQPAIVFTAAPEMGTVADAIPVVASRGGTKYHRLDCPGANTIKDSNKIYFDSIELARSAGYLPASNCPALE